MRFAGHCPSSRGKFGDSWANPATKIIEVYDVLPNILWKSGTAETAKSTLWMTALE